MSCETVFKSWAKLGLHPKVRAIVEKNCIGDTSYMIDMSRNNLDYMFSHKIKLQICMLYQLSQICKSVIGKGWDTCDSSTISQV